MKTLASYRASQKATREDADQRRVARLDGLLRFADSTDPRLVALRNASDEPHRLRLRDVIQADIVQSNPALGRTLAHVGLTDLACDRCGAELVYPDPNICLPSMPPQRNIACVACGFYGTVKA